MKPILSVSDLAWRLHVPVAELRDVAANAGMQYVSWPLFNAKRGISRTIRSPRPRLKEIQRRIKDSVLARLPLAAEAHGGVRGRSAATNAHVHLSQPCVVCVDVKEFFPSVTNTRVYRLFRHELGFGRDVASLLTKLTTCRGEIPQGAPTSVAIANLILAQSLDRPMAKASSDGEIRYTRYVDDIALSGRNPGSLISLAAKLLSRRGLSIHRKKTKLRIGYRGRPQEVTGLLVNGTATSLSKRRRDAIRAAVLSLAQTPDALASVRGRIAHLRQFNPGSARRMAAYVDRIRCL